jgi:hypothetical protein
MRCIDCLDTGYMRANDRIDSPLLKACRISDASTLVSFARPWLSHFGWLERSFCSMSRTLSVCVPKNKWSGFTQNPLSHVWHTYSSPASMFLKSSKEALCARYDFPAMPTDPYRLQFADAPIHSQQPEGCFSTLARNAWRAVSKLNWLYLPQVTTISPGRYVEGSSVKHKAQFHKVIA